MEIADVGKVLSAERAFYVVIQSALQTSSTKGLRIGLGRGGGGEGHRK
jgi:hypothetical protein